jgi:hypothetical protein
VRPTQPPVQWVLGGGAFPGDKVRPGRDADHTHHLVPKSRMSRSYISSSPWRLNGDSGTASLFQKCLLMSHVRSWISIATQQFKQRAYQQHCYVRDNGHGNVSMVTGLLSTDIYWFVLSPCLEITECIRACVWLRTPVGWKTELVLGNCERSTCVWKLPDCNNESLCPKNVEAERAPVFGDFLTARMWVRVWRLPEEVL